MLSQNPAAPSAAIGRNIVAFPAPALPVPASLSATHLARPVSVAPASKPLPVLAPAAALAHDARNALTSLTMIAGLLGEPGVLPGTYRHYAADLERVAQALGSMLERLVDSEKRDQRKAAVDPRERRADSAGQAVEQCAGILKAVAGGNVDVHVSAESKLPPLAIGEDALQRVLVNLVKNAAEAMPEGGTVRITARRALSRNAPAVLVHVSDNGPGIPAHALAQIFEPGFSSKRALLPAGEPCGLGLAIVRELVESAGGAIEVASTRRRGTTFALRLPCLCSPTQA